MAEQVELFLRKLRKSKKLGAVLPSTETEKLVERTEDPGPEGVPAGDGVISQHTKRIRRGQR